MHWKGFVALGAAIIAASVFGYGYWHAATHATFDLNIAYRTGGRSPSPLQGGQVVLLDESGAVLAQGLIDAQYGVVWLAHPEKGYCGPQLAPSEYQECFRAQAKWIPTWVARLRRAHVTLQRCSLNNLPVNTVTYRDNLWLWWLPLPHMLGLPYTRYSATLAIGTARCS